MASANILFVCGIGIHRYFYGISLHTYKRSNFFQEMIKDILSIGGYFTTLKNLGGGVEAEVGVLKV
jgi:hypothetical protein